MPLSVAGHFTDFLWALPMGAALGLLYDIFRFIRLLWNGKVTVFIQDVLFWCLFSLLSFYFVLTYHEGVIRWYTLAGEFLGFWLYYKTVGALLYRAASAILAFVSRVVRWILAAILRPIRWVLNIISRPFVVLYETIRKKLKNLFIFLKRCIIIKKKRRKVDSLTLPEREVSRGTSQEKRKNQYIH